MRIGKSRVNTLTADTFTRVYTNTLTEAATSVTISGLTGDTDEIYILRCKFKNSYAGDTTYYARPNNDSATNYGYQDLSGGDTTVAAGRVTNATGRIISSVRAENHYVYADMTIWAKSGYLRTGKVVSANGIDGTTVDYIELLGLVWNNTADEITSLVILSDQTNGIGVGSQIDLYKLTRKT